MAMPDYYADKLSARRLQRCYEIGPPRVQQYLEAELNYVLEKIEPDHHVLDLGCGYGRTLGRMAERATLVMGIDNAMSSLHQAAEVLQAHSNCCPACIDAASLALADQSFDIVVCIQNGLSAFHRTQRNLMAEAIRVTRRGGAALFSSYSEKFWNNRLHWFELQSQAGLLGEIDYDRTGDGEIVCKDGFTATTVRPDQFQALAQSLGVEATLVEVDNSSLFCEIVRK